MAEYSWTGRRHLPEIREENIENLEKDPDVFCLTHHDELRPSISHLTDSCIISLPPLLSESEISRDLYEP
jgi:hypothetical protein